MNPLGYFNATSGNHLHQNWVYSLLFLSVLVLGFTSGLSCTGDGATGAEPVGPGGNVSIENALRIFSFWASMLGIIVFGIMAKELRAQVNNDCCFEFEGRYFSPSPPGGSSLWRDYGKQAPSWYPPEEWFEDEGDPTRTREARGWWTGNDEFGKQVIWKPTEDKVCLHTKPGFLAIDNYRYALLSLLDRHEGEVERETAKRGVFDELKTRFEEGDLAKTIGGYPRWNGRLNYVQSQMYRDRLIEYRFCPPWGMRSPDEESELTLIITRKGRKKLADLPV